MTLFAPPSTEAAAIQPRPYQQEALDALDGHVCAKDTNPCVVLPTGSGKSLMIAWALLRWKRAYPPFRACILAHRKELVAQNTEELGRLWPSGDVGVYAAGLRRRDLDNAVIYASIDSVFKRWGEFPPFDCLIIDEAHRIPAKGEGKYRQFIEGCRSQNPNLRVAGFTATPFRLSCGPICHKDHILQEICYEAGVGALIRDGYLCRLRSKVGESADLSDVKRNGKGDYVVKSLAAVTNVPEVVQRAVADAVRILNAENRKSIMFFCVDVAHCKAVSAELRRYGINAPQVTGKTPQRKRDRICEDFKAGRYRVLTNINVYTEGFNAKRVDAIVLLRPTLSKGLYAQMVGRGLRTHPSKEDCLVLDYARTIETHGPIDCLDAGRVRLIVCGSVAGPEGWPGGCGDTFSRALGACPHCGWEIPPQEVEREAAVERERQMHEERAARIAILGNEPEDLEVDSVTLHRHQKAGMPDSLKVQYRCELRTFREWICLDHDGFAGQKARQWWARRFGRAEAKRITVDKAVDDLFTAAALTKITEGITVVRRGKYHEITGYKLRDPQ